MQNIIRYANGHGNTQLIVLSMSEAGVGVLNDMLKKLRFASDELQRSEDESGIPLDAVQTTDVDTYSQLVERIRTALLLAPYMRHRFDKLMVPAHHPHVHVHHARAPSVHLVAMRHALPVLCAHS